MVSGVLMLLLPLSETQAAETSPEELGQLWTASISSESANNYDEAVAKIVTFQQKGGDKYLAGLRLGWLAYLKQDYKRATEFYGTASRISPTALSPLLGMLNVAQAQGDTKGTETVANIIIKEEPSNYRALTVLGAQSYAAGDFRKAHSVYRRVLFYYPEDTLGLSGAAWAALKLNERAEAGTLFRKLLSISPNYAYAQEGYDYIFSKRTASNQPGR